MKFVILSAFVIAICFAAVLAQDKMEQARKNIEACLKENNVPPTEFVDYAKSNGAGNAKDSLKCALLCLFNKDGMLDQAGNLNEAAVFQKFSEIPRADVEKAILACKSGKGATPCETAYLMSQCMFASKMVLKI